MLMGARGIADMVVGSLSADVSFGYEEPKSSRWMKGRFGVDPVSSIPRVQTAAFGASRQEMHTPLL